MIETYLVFILIYGTYYFTAFPSVPGGDAGELLAESCQLGTSHPPGYPLYTVLSNIFGRINLPRLYWGNENVWLDLESSVAFRVNNLSCNLAAIAASLCVWSCLYFIDLNGKYKSIGVLVATCLYFTSPLVWEYSIGSEVFALNNSLCSALIFLTVVTHFRITNHQESWKSSASVGALCSGLALSNQHTSLFLVFILFAHITFLSFTHHVLSPSILLNFGVFFILGLTPYSYLYFASINPKPGSWGVMTSWTGFFRHILRSEYGTFQLGVTQSSEGALERILAYLRHTQSESHYLALPLAAIGVLVCLSHRSDISIASDTPVNGNKNGIKMKPTQLTTSQTKSSSKPHRHRGGKKTYTDEAENPIIPSDLLTATASRNETVPGGSADGSSETNHNHDRRSQKLMMVSLVVAWIFYTLIWHCVLSNLPLSSPMPFAVHSRFWMQPNLLLIVPSAVGIVFACNTLEQLARRLSTVFFPRKKPQSKGDASLQSATSGPVFRLIELSVTAVVVGWLITSRWGKVLLTELFAPSRRTFLYIVVYSAMDRSEAGWTMHKYAHSLLSSLPPSSLSNGSDSGKPAVLLLAHTDLNWNPVRYLLSCEESYSKKYSNIRHISIQMVPYPWFRSRQANLYPDFVLPPLSPRVTTNRMDEENGRLVASLVGRNLQTGKFDGGIYVDMQAVSDAEIGPGGRWRDGLVLLPWGLLYRVELNTSKTAFPQYPKFHSTAILHEHRHKESLEQLRLLKENFIPLSASFFRKFPVSGGSWEFAAASVFNDAHYQFGLHLLTYAIEAHKLPPTPPLALLLDRLFVSSDILYNLMESVYGTGELFTTTGSQALSSSLPDLLKNTALCFLRLHGTMEVALQFIKDLEKWASEEPTSTLLLRSSKDLIGDLTEDKLRDIRVRTINVVTAFLYHLPNDKDAPMFNSAVNVIVKKTKAEKKHSSDVGK